MYRYIFILSFSLFLSTIYCEFEPNWDSIDSRPLPEWYDRAKIGIFIHWGVYSVPSFQATAWLWWWWQGEPIEDYVNFMKNHYPPDFTYQDFGPQFTAEFFNPDQWADLFQRSGAKYVVLTSKHHEGYALWPTKYSFGWNSGDVGPKRDLVGDLATAIRAKNLTFGLYHSLYEWFHPLYLEDKANNWQTSSFVDSKIIPQMKELIEKYQPEVLWSDGDWEAPPEYWKSTEFLAWLYNESPVKDTIVTNDRWGSGTMCTHGGYYSCADRFNPGHLMPKKWENAMTIDANVWGYRRLLPIDEVLTPDQLIGTIAQTVSCGGNILINVGPTKEGTIIPIFQERLEQLGNWLSINGEGIYESSSWTVQNDTLTPNVWYTTRNQSVYAFVLFWPEDNILSLGAISTLFENGDPSIVLLGNEDIELIANIDGSNIKIIFPDKAAIISQWAFTLKITPN